MQATGANVVTKIQFDDIDVAKQVVQYNSLDISAEREIVYPSTLTYSRSAKRPINNKLKPNGSLNIPFDSGCLVYWLIALFGDLPKAENVNGKKLYTYKINDDGLHTFTFEKCLSDVSQTERFFECMLNYLKFSYGYEVESFDCIVGIKSTSAEIVHEMFDPNTCSPVCDIFNPWGFSVAINGDIRSDVFEGSFSFENNVSEDEYEQLNESIGELSEGITSVTGKLKMVYTDSSDEFLSRVRKGETFSVVLTFKKDNTDSSDYLRLTLPEVIFELTSPIVKDDYGVNIQFDWTAFNEEDSNSSSVIAELFTSQVI